MMRIAIRLPGIALLLLLSGCKQQTATSFTNNCKRNPSFVQPMSGFNPGKSFFSTSVISKMGLVLVEQTANGYQYFQDSSWSKAGWLGQVTLDENGDIFTAPAPFINLLNNPAANQNKIFRVDSRSAKMDEFFSLPLADSNNSENPYGILGMTYNCDASILYVSSVAGSDRNHERGVVFAIETRSKKIVDQLEGIDVLGLGLSRASGTLQLFLGSARSSNILSIDIATDGRFKGAPRLAFNLSGLGIDGNDHARKIEKANDSTLLVHAMEFSFNLIPAREKRETFYEIRFFQAKKSWQLMSVK